MNDLFGNPTAISKCSIAQAMSALVKSVRLRHVEDAVYWYLHIAKCFPNDTFRLRRRMLIIGAEDCIDPKTQRNMYEWFKRTLGNKDIQSIDKTACYVLQKICITENWWQSPSGQKYICQWRISEKRVGNSEYLANPQSGKSYIQDISDLIDKALKNPEINYTYEANCIHLRLIHAKENRIEYAQMLVNKGIEYGNVKARMAAQTHVSYGKILGSLDDNWLGHALFRILGNTFEAKDISTIKDTEQLYTSALSEVYKKSRTPFAWTQDGVHCSGKDRRFAGLLTSMVACCNVYNEFGYLSPEIAFENKHYSSEILKEHHAL